jgi:hypothetical protein
MRWMPRTFMLAMICKSKISPPVTGCRRLSEAGFEEAAFLGTTGYRTSPEKPRILIYRGKIRLK